MVLRCFGKHSVIPFILGMGFTFFISIFLWPHSKYDNTFTNIDTPHGPHVDIVPQKPHSEGEFDEEFRKIGDRLKPMNWADSEAHSHEGEDIIAKSLSKSVRVFCWIMTMPNNHKNKAIHVKATWVKRCNKYVFMSTKEDPDLPSIGLPVNEGRDNLWAKTKAAYKHIHQYYINDYDFFLKADDDTYVVLENLRFMLRNVNPDNPIFFGRKFKPYVKQGYMSGGAGYILSREAVKRFINDGIDKNPHCPSGNGGAEDVNVGLCLESVGVIAGDSRDDMGRERFHPFPPESHLNTDTIGKDNWLFSWNFYPLVNGPGCCSDTTVSFHYVSPHLMYTLEFFIYHMHPFGIVPDYSHITKYLHDHLEEKNKNIEDHHHEEQDKKPEVNNENSQIVQKEKLPEKQVEAKAPVEKQHPPAAAAEVGGGVVAAAAAAGGGAVVVGGVTVVNSKAKIVVKQNK